MNKNELALLSVLLTELRFGTIQIEVSRTQMKHARYRAYRTSYAEFLPPGVGDLRFSSETGEPPLPLK